MIAQAWECEIEALAYHRRTTGETRVSIQEHLACRPETGVTRQWHFNAARNAGEGATEQANTEPTAGHAPLARLSASQQRAM